MFYSSWKLSIVKVIKGDFLVAWLCSLLLEDIAHFIWSWVLSWKYDLVSLAKDLWCIHVWVTLSNEFMSIAWDISVKVLGHLCHLEVEQVKLIKFTGELRKGIFHLEDAWDLKCADSTSRFFTELLIPRKTIIYELAIQSPFPLFYKDFFLNNN